MQGSPYLTPAELAERLIVKEATLVDWRYHHTGPPYVKAGRLVRYPLAEVEAWEAAHLVGNGKGPDQKSSPSPTQHHQKVSRDPE